MWERVNQNYIKNVVVISNNAVLDYSGKLTRSIDASFPGTFYIIELDKNNIDVWQSRLKTA